MVYVLVESFQFAIHTAIPDPMTTDLDVELDEVFLVEFFFDW